MMLACQNTGSNKSHRVYITMRVGKVDREFLLDSGCGTTIIPTHYAKGRRLRKSNKEVRAANDAEIPIKGEVTIDLQLGNFIIPTEAIVSDFVTEAMIGYNWLAQNDCFWGFRTGEVMIHGQIFQLRERDNSDKCCRVTVQERVTLPPRSETIIATRAVFDHVNVRGGETPTEYATIPSELEAGVYAARAIIPHKCANIPVRVLNTTNKPVVLRRARLVAKLEPVRVEVKKCEEISETEEEEDWKRKLLSGLDEEISEEDVKKVEEILTEYQDCFSQSEFDLGRTTLVTHQIETGGNAPIRQGL